MWRSRILAVVFSAVLALTTSVPAFANHKPGHHPPGHNRNAQQQQQQQSQTQEQHQCILVLGLLQPATC